MFYLTMALMTCSVFIFGVSPCVAYCMVLTAFILLLYQSMNQENSEQNGLDFGQELDYDTASKMCRKKIADNADKEDYQLRLLANRIVEKNKAKILSKMAKGSYEVNFYVGLYPDTAKFKRYVREALGCGDVYASFYPFCLKVYAK